METDKKTSIQKLVADQTQSASEPTTEQKEDRTSQKILRFRKSERYVHWALAIPFLVCFASATVLVFHYNPDPSRAYRDVFSWIHRISGACLIVLPMLAAFRARGDITVHFYNIRQAWIWAFDDIKWLLLQGIVVFNKKIQLPDQGKFNAAEKLNFMVLMATYPLYVLTGLAMWFTHASILAWIIHGLMAVMATPLILGHIYMATINPATRKGLSGMITGKVDRDWAKHHYAIWYREHFEEINQKEISAVTHPAAEGEDRNNLGEFEKTLRKVGEQSGAMASSAKMNYYLGLAYEESGWIDKAIEKYSTCLTEWDGEEDLVAELEDVVERLAKLMKLVE